VPGKFGALLDDLRLLTDDIPDQPGMSPHKFPNRHPDPEQAKHNPQKRAPEDCPDGSYFDGKHCVPNSGKKKARGDRAESEHPTEPHRTRHRPPEDPAKDLKVDPKLLERPDNKVTYATGRKPFEYADAEWVEYSENPIIRSVFPEAFDTPDEFVMAFLKAQTKELHNFTKVENTDAANIKKGDFEALADSMWRYKADDWRDRSQGNEQLAHERFEDHLNGLVSKLQGEHPDTAPPVIIGVYEDPSGEKTYHVVSGNSRAMIYAYLGKPAPVRYVPLKGPKGEQPNPEEMKEFDASVEAGMEPEDAIAKMLEKRKARRTESVEPRSVFKMVFEMPHLALDKDSPLAGDKRHFGAVDLQIEKYPLPPAERTQLLRSFEERGVVGWTKKGWLFFSPDDKVAKATSEQIQALARLPDFWEKFFVNYDEGE
jgi:hypothetical protein